MNGRKQYDEKKLESKPRVVNTDEPARDMTERPTTEITENKEFFSNIFKLSPIGIILINTVSGKYVDVNDSFLKMIGYERDEIIGYTSAELNITDTDARERIFARMAKEGFLRNAEIPFIKKSGEIILVAFSCEKIIISGEVHLLSTLQDITEQKQAEEKLKKTTLLLAEAQRLARIGSWEWRVADNTITWSDGIYRIFGFNKDDTELTYDSLLERVHPEDKDRVEELEQYQPDNGTFDAFYRINRKNDGAVRMLHRRVKIEYDAEGNGTIQRGTVQDVTQQKKQIAQYAQNLIEASLDPLVTINPEGKITGMNEAFINATDLSREKMMDTDFFKYFTEPLKAQEVCKAVFSKGFVKNYPLSIKDHELTHVLFNGSVYKDEHGKVLGAVVIARDVTELKKTQVHLEESLKEVSSYKKALDQSSFVSITNEFGIITYVNDNFCRFFQFSSKELIGQDHRIVNSGYHPKSFIRDLWTTIQNGEIWRGEINNKAKNGANYWMDTSIVPFLNDEGKIYQYIAIRTDITEQKNIAIELLESKRLAEMATTIAEEAKIKAVQAAEIAENASLIAENAVKAKQQFLSNMSHEIRTPMNAIIGFTKVMLKTDLSVKQKEYLQAIKISGDALIVLINDILDLAKVDAGKMSFEATPFKLSTSVSAMLHLFETKIQEKNLKLVTHYDSRIPEVLLGDPGRLHQIILNLVSNAVKFTPSGQITVDVRLLVEEENEVFVKFAITDTGIGISEDMLKTIFENFQQASNGTSRLYGGTGLGLAIVKQLVEQQDGDIYVKSVVDKGSTFSFVLNFQKTDALIASEPNLLVLDNPTQSIRVLVVEDIVLNQLLMNTLLDDFGFECDMAANGRIAIQKLKKNVYDVILMDLQMPEMNGFEATEYIRNTMKLQVPIIALTADVTTADLEKCTAVGMNDYVAKPVDERLLYSKMVGLIKKTALLKEQEAYQKQQIQKVKCTDLQYLMRRTKSNPHLMMEMIALYLEQTPPLIRAMKQSIQIQDWQGLRAAVHKMIPSFSIVGIGSDYENMARKIHEYALKQLQSEGIDDLILQLENICMQACEELKIEFDMIKNNNT